MNSKPIIAYYRVSTKQQGESGLGLEGQKAAVERYSEANGCRILATYTEVESGKNSERPQLRAAMIHAKRAKATLVVAKLDRLSRNLHFLSGLMEAKVPFVACDNPTANELTIHILAAVAQQEAKAISERTKTALAAAKARGQSLGSAREGHWTGKEDRRLVGARKGNERSAKVRSANASKAHAELCPVLIALRSEGLTLGQMAERLNADGWKTRQGKDWNTVYVCRFLKQCV
jgi:DNA invertase Pin-like site-specific DNA recombinase